ncbi:hypothetical protein HYX58_02420 [Candidatus Dependentiae bacterium]|nr:hypothetical protein [Candidatus Dependentiae bacterium]
MVNQRTVVVLLSLLLSFIFVEDVFSMEGVESTLVREAAEEAGVVGAESIGKAEAEALTREVADSMGVSVEDIKNLPEDAKQAFKDELKAAFKNGDVTSIENGKFVTESPQSFKTFLSKAKGDFATQVEKIAEEKGLPSLSKATLEKFGVQADILEKFPIREPKLEIPNVEIEAELLSPEDKGIQEAQDTLAGDKANAKYLEETGQTDLEKPAQEKVIQDEKNVDVKIEEKVEAKTKIVSEEQAKLSEAQQQVSANEKGGDPEKTLEAKDKLQEQETKTQDAQKEQTISERQSSKSKYDRANKEYKEAQAKTKNAKEELAEAKKNGWSKEVVDSKETALKNAQESERTAYEDYDSAKKEWIEKSGNFEALDLKAIEKAKSIIKEHIITSIISGFAFAIPNFVIGPITEAMNRKAQLDQLRQPQAFGTIWMQIPITFINDGAPLSSFMLYVGIDAQSGSEVSKRNDDADTDSFLQYANYYVSISDYGELGPNNLPIAITDPSFPFRMLHLNSGYHFINAGLPADPENPAIPLLKIDPKGKAKFPVQEYLDQLGGSARQGIAGAVYEESREQATGYKGDIVVADLFEQGSNKSSTFALKEGEGYGKLLAPAIIVLQNSYAFGPFNLTGFSALNDDQIKQLSNGQITKAIPNYPYVSYSVPPTGFVYQTKDTPDIQAIVKQLGSDNKLSALLRDYVVLVDPKAPTVLQPLLVPSPIGSTYGTPSLQPTPNAGDLRMVSLISGNVYTYDGNSSKADANLAQAEFPIDENIRIQAAAMKGVYDAQWKDVSEQLKYGPFKIGTVQLSIDKQLAEAGVFVYKVDSPLIENGTTDYVVPLIIDENKNLVVGQLPDDNVKFFVSVITSRFYDKMLNPAPERSPFFVYKSPTGSFRLVASSKENSQYGDVVFKGDKTALYTLFMNPEINPTKPTPDQQKALANAGAKTADGKSTVAAQLLPLPAQWALSDQGLVVDPADPKTYLGAFINQKAPQFRSQLDGIFTAWKNSMLKDPSLLKIELGPYRFTTDQVQNIELYATSVDDLKNGSYVYTSDRWPAEFFVLSDDKDGTSNLGQEYNLAAPQRYAISLSNGQVHDAQQSGQVVGTISDLDQLLDRAQRSKKYLPNLLKNIQATQGAYLQTVAEQQFNENTMFGRFRFFISQDDLKNGAYIYGDATDINDPLKLQPKELQSRIKNYFVTIEGPINDENNWIYGNKLNENTVLVISLVSGALYDRGGSYQGNLKRFDPSLDTAQGFLEKIVSYLEKTWGSNNPSIGRLKDRVNALTKAWFAQLEQERKQIAQEREAEEKIYAPLSANTIANLKSAQYVQDLLQMPIPRYLKLLGDGKYYFESPDAKAGEDQTPKVYIDYNVGEPGKDNGIGMSYDSNGAVIGRFTGWLLENLRAYAGIVIDANGKQTLDIASDHPSIPTDSMIKIDAGGMEKLLGQQRINLGNAQQRFAKNPNDKAAVQALNDALYNYNKIQVANESAQAVKAANLPASPSLRYDFYYNPEITTYFVKISSGGKEYYYDLVGGYGYYVDGKPRLRENQVFIKKGSTKNELFIAGQDGVGLFVASYLDADGEYHLWSTAANPGRSKDGKSYSYALGSDDGRTALILQSLNSDGSIKQYSVWPVGDNQQASFLADYNPGSLYSTILRYARTNGAYVKADAPRAPVMVIWNGQPDLNFQYLLYNYNLIELKSAGNGSFTGSYKKEDGTPGTITLKTQEKTYSPLVKSHWVAITDGGISYDFVFDTMVLDPNEPTKCEVNALEKLKLSYWKQCAWGLNVVTDSRGQTRLVHKLPSTDSLQTVDQTMVHGVPANSDAGKILSDSLSRLSYDAASDRFVYQLSATDKGFAYYQDKMNNWFVDLANGVVFDPTMATAGGVYPVGALIASQLDTLLARINLSVTLVEDPNGKPGYDRFGNPIMKGNKPVKLKPGLVYRMPANKGNLPAPRPAQIKRPAPVKRSSARQLLAPVSQKRAPRNTLRRTK